MNRRGFLSALTAFAAAATLDPERALWVRGAKTISIPKPAPNSGWGKASFDLKQGDVFTISGHYELNPSTMKPVPLFTPQGEIIRDHLGNTIYRLKDYWVVSGAQESFPNVIGSGQYQNCIVRPVINPVRHKRLFGVPHGETISA